MFLGYGNLTPKTDIGKLTTIFYALAGIPLMFIYMSTIGSILATSFKYTYTKLCRLERCCYYCCCCCKVNKTVTNYISTIIRILANSFKYTYTKLCRLVRCCYYCCCCKVNKTVTNYISRIV